MPDLPGPWQASKAAETHDCEPLALQRGGGLVSGENVPDGAVQGARVQQSLRIARDRGCTEPTSHLRTSCSSRTLHSRLCS